jgi:hypothetical protein
MPDPNGIDFLLQKLKAARFSGTLELRFESGQVASASLIHFLPFKESTSELPFIGSRRNAQLAQSHGQNRRKSVAKPYNSKIQCTILQIIDLP